MNVAKASKKQCTSIDRPQRLSCDSFCNSAETRARQTPHDGPASVFVQFRLAAYLTKNDFFSCMLVRASQKCLDDKKQVFLVALDPFLARVPICIDRYFLDRLLDH
jgi:hypothetical protein